MIDIHGQHEHQSLLSKKKHLDILDAYAKGTKITLPTFSASDLSGIDTTKSNIVITCDSKSGTTTKTIKFVDMYEDNSRV